MHQQNSDLQVFNMRKKKLLVSNCLLGIPCNHAGSHSKLDCLEELDELYNLIGVCPEEIGGLETPREHAEIYLNRVITQTGRDVTYECEYGADLTLNIAKGHAISCALLQDYSASCGCGYIYNGQFNGGLTKGDGLTARLLKANGIEVIPASKAKTLL